MTSSSSEYTPLKTESEDPSSALQHSDKPAPGPLPLKAKFVVLSAVLGGFLFGYDTGIVNGALVKLEDDKPNWQLTDSRKELIVSSAVWACAAGALLAGPLNKYYGRKVNLMSGAAILALSSLVMSQAASWGSLVLSRAVAGVGIGFLSLTSPLYIAEQLPDEWRGPMTVCNQLLITVGILCGSVVAGLLEPVSGGWRWMFGLGCIPAVLMFLILLHMPRSVRWLYFTGHADEARTALKELRGAGDITWELEELANDLNRTTADKELGGEGLTLLGNMVRNVAVRRALLVGVMLQMFQQLSGINSVIYYSSTILVMAGASSNEAIWLSAAVSTANVAFTFIGLAGIERVGRKLLLLSSMLVMIIGLVLMASAFYIIHQDASSISTAGTSDCVTSTCYECINTVSCGVCTSSDNTLLCAPLNTSSSFCRGDISRVCKTNGAWLATLGLVVYIMGFAPGMGPLPWSINSEIFPNWARDTAMSITTFTCWISNSIVSQTFLRLSAAATPSGAFLTYGGATLLGLLYFYIFLPETKGLSLEHTEELFSGRQTFVGLRAGHGDSCGNSDTK